MDDCSCERLTAQSRAALDNLIRIFNISRDIYVNWDSVSNGVKRIYDNNRTNAWYEMIQLLPTSYNQRRTVTLNYEVLLNMYHARRNHKLDEWRELCGVIETLPYFKEICLEGNNDGE
jgi:hypothetical protein